MADRRIHELLVSGVGIDLQTYVFTITLKLKKIIIMISDQGL